MITYVINIKIKKKLYMKYKSLLKKYFILILLLLKIKLNREENLIKSN